MARIAAISSAAGNTPFFVTTRKNPDNTALYQAMVASGDLLKSLQPNDSISITGLNSWFPLIANDVIWIYVNILNFNAITATIQSYGLGNSGFNPTKAAWDNTGGFVQDDGAAIPHQIAANVLIAESVPDTTGAPSVTQKLFTHLLLTSCAITTEAAIFPVPSPYGRYIT